jgi:hypothetical protein
MELTLEQKRAMATANARLRIKNKPTDAVQSTSDQPEQVDSQYEAQQLNPSNDSALGAFGRGVDSGFMFGFDDEIGAGMMAPLHAAADWVRGDGFNLSENYRELQQELDAEKDYFRDKHPVASTAGEVYGALGAGAAATKNGFTLAGRSIPLVSKTGAAMLEGGAYGALYGAGEADTGETLEGAAVGAATGAVAAGALSKLGDTFANLAESRLIKKAMPAVDDMKANAQALYDKMRNSGVKVKEAKIQRTLGRITSEMKNTTPELAPNATSLIGLLKRDLVGDVDYQVLHNASKTVNRISRTNLQGDDKFYVGEIKRILDRSVNYTSKKDLIGPQNVGAMKTEADKLWTQLKKTEIIDDLFEKAQNQATGFENGLVSQFRSLANNKKTMKQFNANEQKMIKDLIRRGSARGIFRGLGMLSPTSTFGSLLFGGAAVGGGIVPAAVMAGAGMGSRKAAEALTRGKANSIKQAVQSGIAPSRVGTNKTSAALGAAAVEANHLLDLAGGR